MEKGLSIKRREIDCNTIHVRGHSYLFHIISIPSPKKGDKSYRKMMRDFLWEGTNGESQHHRVAWETLHRQKNKGLAEWAILKQRIKR